MRLKEIEKRLAEIRKILDEEAETLTEERIAALDKEVDELQEERENIIKAQQRRQSLLNRIANDLPVEDENGNITQATVLRSFGNPNDPAEQLLQQAGNRTEDRYDTLAYRTAFMEFVCRGTAIPAELRAAETTTTADSTAVIPTSIMSQIIQKLESYGEIYAQVTKLQVQGGLEIPILDLKPKASWITEEKASDDQKVSAKQSVSFKYNGLECKISQTILANVTTLKMFNDLFIPMATEAMVKAIEIAIFNGTGQGQPTGVLKDERVETTIELSAEDVASWKGWHKVKGKIKKAYRNGSFIMNQSTFDSEIDGMEDKNGQPIGRTNYGINGEETYRLMGKTVQTVEDDVLPSYEDAEEGEVFAVFMKLSDYIINSNMEMQVTKWTDHDTNKLKNKCLMVVDGKAGDTNGIILIKKATAPVI